MMNRTMTDRQKQIAGFVLIGVTGLNLLMCLNLYRAYGDLVYQLSSVEGSVNSALQSLSRDVWDLKSTNQPHNRTGEFE